jgi:hypothetical protein
LIKEKRFIVIIVELIKGKHLSPKIFIRFGRRRNTQQQTLRMAEHGWIASQKKRYRIKMGDEINENKNIDIIKEKKRRENITTDVYILGQCNQVENKKEKNNQITE